MTQDKKQQRAIQQLIAQVKRQSKPSADRKAQVIQAGVKGAKRDAVKGITAQVYYLRARATNEDYLKRCALVRAHLITALDAGNLASAKGWYARYQQLWSTQQGFKRLADAVHSSTRGAVPMKNAIAPEMALCSYIARHAMPALRTRAQRRVNAITGKHFDPPAGYDAQKQTDLILRAQKAKRKGK